MNTSHEETPLDQGRPIIDPHLHLWDILASPGSLQLPHRFLFDELRAAVEASGHAITHTVFVQCGQMYRQDGPEEMRVVGETEFANGIAAMAASGNYGPCQVSHRIVGTADLCLGAAVRPVLEAHCAAAGERFRGIRTHVAFSETGLFGFPCDPDTRQIMRRPAFREGARVLAEMDLSMDVWPHYTQLDELAELADLLPGLTIILDHAGTPDPQNCAETEREEARRQWESGIRELARRSNILIKLGGLGMNMSKMIGRDQRNASSQSLAGEWRGYIESCIEALSPARAMFESNFPPDNDAGSYGATWNAFKIIAKDFSEDEKDDLFRRTAARTYRIAVDD